MKEQNFRRYWWLPDTEENRVAGVLSYSQDSGISLELFDTFSNESFSQEVKYSLIYGLTDEGDKVQLNDCRRMGFSYSGEASTATYRAETMSINEKGVLPSTNFNQLNISIPLLDRWFDGVPRATMGHNMSNERPKNISIGVELPEDKLYSSDGPDIYLRIKGSPSVGRGGGEIEVTPELRFDFGRASADTSEWKDHIFKICNLIAFATDEPVVPNYIRGLTKYDDRPDITSEAFYEPRVGREIDTDKHQGRFRFTSDNYHGDRTSIIEKWLRMYSDFRIVLDTYCAMVYKNQYLSNKLISVIGCVEGYYNRQFPQTNYGDDNATQAIEYLTERNYDQLTDDKKENLSQQEFVEDIMMARNYFLHQKEADREDIIENEYLGEISMSLQFLFDVELLKYLDIDEARINNGLRPKYGMQWVQNPGK